MMNEFTVPTTPKARKAHLDNLIQLLVDNGWVMDQWNNWKLPDYSKYRIKFKKVNVRVERKSSQGDWVSTGFSRVISQLSPDVLLQAMKAVEKKKEALVKSWNQ
jgi:ribosomal protein S17